MKLNALLGDQKLNYTGIHFDDGTHMTWKYGFPLEYPEGVEVDDKAEVKVVGTYEDEQVACYVVEWKTHKKQPKKETLLHVTTKVENGGKPVMSGQRATDKGFEEVKPFILKGVWK